MKFSEAVETIARERPGAAITYLVLNLACDGPNGCIAGLDEPPVVEELERLVRCFGAVFGDNLHPQTLGQLAELLRSAGPGSLAERFRSLVWEHLTPFVAIRGKWNTPDYPFDLMGEKIPEAPATVSQLKDTP